MPPTNEARYWVCAGTKRVSIAEVPGEPSDGLIAVYSSSEDGNNGGGGNGRRAASPKPSRMSSDSTVDGNLHVFVTDGSRTFYQR